MAHGAADAARRIAPRLRRKKPLPGALQRIEERFAADMFEEGRPVRIRRDLRRGCKAPRPAAARR